MSFDMYNPIDLIILGAITVGFILGIWKGFVRTLTALASLAFGVVLAIKYYPTVEPYLGKISALEPHLAMAISMILIFIAVQVIFVIIRRILSAIIDVTNLSWLDRVLGAVMGVFTACLIAAAGIQIALMGMGDSDIVKKSKLARPVNELTSKGLQFLPASSQKRLQNLADKWKKERRPQGLPSQKGSGQPNSARTPNNTENPRPNTPAGNPHLPSTTSPGPANRN